MIGLLSTEAARLLAVLMPREGGVLESTLTAIHGLPADSLPAATDELREAGHDVRTHQESAGLRYHYRGAMRRPKRRSAA